MNRISALFTYPVKGLAPHPLSSADVEEGGTFTLDRAYALKKGEWPFDPAHPAYMRKTHFFMLMQDEKLAELKVQFDLDTHSVFLESPSGESVGGMLSEASGRAEIEGFMNKFLEDETVILSAPNHSFADVSAKVISFINLASVCDLGRAMKADIDFNRFRANVYFDNEKPWSEFDWIGKKLKIGTVVLEVIKRIDRCAATTVNPKSAQRDLQVPKALMEYYGHIDMGVYARVLSAGTISKDDIIEIVS